MVTESAPPTEKTESFKKETSSKVFISEDELKSLEAKVLTKRKEDEQEIYKRALAEVRSEFEATQKVSLEEKARLEQQKLLEDLKKEVEALKAAPGTRQSIPAVENPFKRSEDGKRLGVPKSLAEEATRKKYFPEARPLTRG